MKMDAEMKTWDIQILKLSKYYLRRHPFVSIKYTHLEHYK